MGGFPSSPAPETPAEPGPHTDPFEIWGRSLAGLRRDGSAWGRSTTLQRYLDSRQGHGARQWTPRGKGRDLAGRLSAPLRCP